MKAIIVKDDTFKTVGFEVSANGQLVFGWGISPNPMYFTKEINAKDWFTDIIHLIELRQRKRELDNFISKWFDIAKKNGMYNGESVKFTEINEELKSVENTIKNIIANII